MNEDSKDWEVIWSAGEQDWCKFPDASVADRMAPPIERNKKTGKSRQRVPGGWCVWDSQNAPYFVPEID